MSCYLFGFFLKLSRRWIWRLLPSLVLYLILISSIIAHLGLQNLHRLPQISSSNVCIHYILFIRCTFSYLSLPSVLECTSLPGPQIRIIINDAVAPLTGISGCPKQKDGMCPVDTFVAAQKEIVRNTDWEYDCHGNWTVPPGTEWETITGDTPKTK